MASTLVSDALCRALKVNGYPNMEFSDILKRARIKSKKSVAECANLAGVNRDAWHKYERGERHPHVSDLPRIAAACGVTISRLFRPF
jgi:transcriptional regulator with XRE-family HTH domain